MPHFSFSSALSRAVFIVFGLLISIAVQAGTFNNTSTALTAPATSSTGSYTVSFKTSAFGTHYLQEKKDSGSWANIKSYWTASNGTVNYASITRNVSVSGRDSGTYSYRIYFVTGSSTSYPAAPTGYSNIKITVVALIPGIPASISTPVNDNDGDITVSWGIASGAVTSYKLEQQLDSGSWIEIYSGTDTLQTLAGLADGTYQYRVKACNSEGCSSHQLSSNSTIVAHTPGVPPSATLTTGETY